MRTMTIAALLGAVAISGCAARASSIAPVSVTATDYAAMPCDRAREELAATNLRVDALSRRQNNAAMADAAGVFLLFVPVGSLFGGGVEGELGRAKGEQAALERNIQTRCGG